MGRKVAVLLWVIAIVFTSGALSHEPGSRVLLNASNIPFVYESRSRIKSPIEPLAHVISVDYRNGDQFTRHEMLPQLKPVIEEEIKHAQGIKLVTIKVAVPMKLYDFDGGGFPTGINGGALVPIGQYGVTFENVSRAAILKVDKDRAKMISRIVPVSRTILLLLHGTVESASEVNNLVIPKQLHVRLTSMEGTLENGTFIARNDL